MNKQQIKNLEKSKKKAERKRQYDLQSNKQQLLNYKNKKSV